MIPAGAQLASGQLWVAGGIWVTLKGPALLGPLTIAPAPQEGLSPLCSEPPRNGSPAPRAVMSEPPRSQLSSEGDHLWVLGGDRLFLGAQPPHGLSFSKSP